MKENGRGLDKGGRGGGEIGSIAFSEFLFPVVRSKLAFLYQREITRSAIALRALRAPFSDREHLITFYTLICLPRIYASRVIQPVLL